MATPSKPFNPPFAENGDREQVGVTSDDNSVNYTEGYTLPYEKPPQDGGKDIERKKLNQILFDFCEKVNDLSQEIDKWTALTNENLNNITQNGRYYQNLNHQATTLNNYPVTKAGYLLIFNNGINSYGVTQIYKVWDSDKFFIRRTTSATTWSNWDRVTLQSEFLQELNKKRDITDSYSRQETQQELNKKRDITDSYSQQETQDVVKNVVQIWNNGDFINYYNKSKISVFAVGRAYNMNANSWIDVQLRCPTTGEIGATGTWYASGGARDATICLSATFNTNGYDRLYFALEPMYGGGQIDYLNFIGVFFD